MKVRPIWSPSDEAVENCNLTKFSRPLGFDPPDYRSLYQWSINNRPEFWANVWDFTGVLGERDDEILVDGDDFLASNWFPNARLNYAENLLSKVDESPAIISYVEDGERVSISYSELREKTAQFAAELKSRGVKPGDRVAGLLPNVPETVIAMLGCSSVGAIWSSCSPDFGFQGALDRFSQITPKVLVAVDGYRYNGTDYDISDNVDRLANEVSSIKDVIWLHSRGNRKDDFEEIWRRNERIPTFSPLPFNHPLFIMYSSGTTGRPKCITHGAGSTLLQHLKEHQLHVDLKPGSTIFFFTTCGWMMWNWLVSALASKATIVLYDGSPFKPRPDALINLIDEDHINVFGAGAKYYSSIEKAKVRPKKTHALDSLRSIQSTGSPLAHESFDYIYSSFKSDVALASISGGTDLISCFALGIPWLPVYRGELQGPGLGMDIDVYDEMGNSIRGEKGELVCKTSFPCSPIGFWNDAENAKYREAYFERFPGIWAHGDFAEINEETHGVIIHGRSDAVLNPGGVRIGTAEIYRQVESMTEIQEALCIGQAWENDVRIVLFVLLSDGVELNEDLTQRIKSQIRTNASPRHVPAVILAVDDIPRTRSGKIAEIAVREIVHGRDISNTSALANAESLDQFRDLPALAKQ